MSNKCPHDPPTHFCKDCSMLLCKACATTLTSPHRPHKVQTIKQAIAEKWCEIPAKFQQLTELKEALAKASTLYQLGEIAMKNKESRQSLFQKVNEKLKSLEEVKKKTLEALVQNPGETGLALLKGSESEIKELEEKLRESEDLAQSEIDQFFVEWLETRYKSKVLNETVEKLEGVKLDSEEGIKKAIELYGMIMRKADQAWSIFEENTKKASATQKELQAVREKLFNATEELQRCKKEVANEKAGLEQLKTDKENLKQEITKLNDKHKSIRLELDKEEKNKQEIESEKIKVTVEVRCAKKELELIRNETSERMSKVALMETKLEECDLRLEEKTSKLESVKEEMKKLKENLEKTHSDLSKGKEELVKLEENMRQVKGQLKKEEQVLELIISEKQEAEKNIKSLNEMMKKDYEKIKSVQSNLEHTETKYKEKTKAMEILQEQCENLLIKERKYKMQIEEAQATLRELNAKTQEASLPKSLPQKEYKLVYAELEELTKECRKKRLTFNTLKEETDKLVQTHEFLKGSCEEYKKKIEAFKDQLAKVEQDKKLVSELAERISTLQENEMKLNITVRGLKNKKTAISKLLTKENRALEKYKSTCEQLKAEACSVFANIKKYLDYINELKEMLAEKVFTVIRDYSIRRKEVETMFNNRNATSAELHLAENRLKGISEMIEGKKAELVKLESKRSLLSSSVEMPRGSGITIVSAFGNIVIASQVSLSNKDPKVPEAATFEGFFLNFSDVFKGVEKMTISCEKSFEVNKLDTIRKAKMSELTLKNLKLRDNIDGLWRVKDYIELDHCFVEEKDLLNALKDLLCDGSRLKTIKIFDDLWTEKVLDEFFNDMILKKLIADTKAKKTLKTFEIGLVKTSENPRLKAKVVQLKALLDSLITIHEI